LVQHRSESADLVTVIILLRNLPIAVAATAMAGAGGVADADRIKATGTVTFAYRDGAAPFSFKARNGRPQGYSVELCERSQRPSARRSRCPH
jgi:ABC-type amino acid transport substrate-binding protein